ncbi:hypothetical protein [Nocardia sp. NPDC046763]|uniref:hypothetical protein n=1 Tax=Nocardia sp. NPDC046763 TaxID=3155256 RepID=UPI0033FA3DBB
MSDNLDAHPDEFRSIASSQAAAAARFRELEFPHTYFDTFLECNGTLQAPVKACLFDGWTKIYQGAQDTIAAGYEHGSDCLLDGANRLEETDVLQTSAGLDETSSQRNA